VAGGLAADARAPSVFHLAITWGGFMARHDVEEISHEQLNAELRRLLREAAAEESAAMVRASEAPPAARQPGPRAA
jgi:hypothetical protein